MARALREVLASLCRDIERFLSQNEGYGAARDLATLEELVTKLPLDERQQWLDRVSSFGFSDVHRIQAMKRGEEEIRYARRLVDDASTLIYEEMFLLLSNVMSLRYVQRQLQIFCSVPWAHELEMICKEIGALRESSDVGPLIRRCEATIRHNTEVFLT